MTSNTTTTKTSTASFVHIQPTSSSSASLSTTASSTTSTPESKSTSTSTSINRRQIIEEVANVHELSIAKSERIVATVLDTIMEGVADGKTVSVSKFGTLEKYSSKARTGRNPSTGEPLEIPEKTRIRFRPSKHFKETVQV
jgi:DNA-binding protein HU-beta